MTDWKKQKAFYLSQGRPEDQKDDDMLAGRIMLGLGYKTPKHAIYNVERAVLGTTHGDRPLWVRVRDVLLAVLLRNKPQLATRMVIESAKVAKSADAYERMSMSDLKAAGKQSVLFARLGHTPQCYAYTFWTKEDLPYAIKPPFSVLGNMDGYENMLFTQQDAVHFVEQFGPYEIQLDAQDII